jgi:hypothetical protein
MMSVIESLFNKGKPIGGLLLSSFELLGEDNVKTLILVRCRFSIICHLLFLAAVTFIIYDFHPFFSWLLLLTLIFCVYPYSFFFHVNKRAQQTWAAYGKITNRPTALEEAQKIAIHQKWPLRLFAVAEFFIPSPTEDRRNNSQSVSGFLISLGLAALGGVFDLAESYLLPALMIEQCSLKEAAHKLKQLKQNVPVALTGSFGLDIFGGVVSALLFFIYTGIFLLGVAMTWGAANFLPLPTQWISTIPLNQGPLHVFWFPLVVSIVFISLIGKLINIFITSMKATYFAVFYTAVNKPQEISPEFKEKVIDYLNQCAGQ